MKLKAAWKEKQEGCRLRTLIFDYQPEHMERAFRERRAGDCSQ